jgi:hypothetical protein
VPEIGSPGLMWRGLETGLRRTYTGTQLETADTAKGGLRGTAPVLDPTRVRALPLVIPSPTSNLGCYGSRGFVGLLRHSVTIARTQVFTGFMTSEGMCRVA